MASSKRRPGKRSRNQQNRAKRAALAERSARAGEATAINRGDRQPVLPAGESAAEEPKGRRGRRAGRDGAERPRRPAPPSRFTIPGQRAVFMSLLFAIVSAGTLLLAPLSVERELEPDDPRVLALDAEDRPEPDEDGLVVIDEEVKLLDEEGAGVAIAILAIPIAVTGAAVAFTKRRQRSNAWSIAMLGMAFFIFFIAGPYGLISLPSMIALAVGGFQSRRAETKARLAARDAAAASSDGATEVDHDTTEVADEE